MEVHHHSHHGKKKWTENFWEFLMLFLAVFCGFLAEYQLEHKIEKDREKQFVGSQIHKTETSNRIMDYYSQFPWIRLLEGNFNREFDAHKTVAVKVIDPGIYRRLENTDGTVKRSNDNSQLLSYDPLLLKQMEFYGSADEWKPPVIDPACRNTKAICRSIIKVS